MSQLIPFDSGFIYTFPFLHLYRRVIEELTPSDSTCDSDDEYSEVVHKRNLCKYICYLFFDGTIISVLHRGVTEEPTTRGGTFDPGDKQSESFITDSTSESDDNKFVYVCLMYIPNHIC